MGLFIPFLQPMGQSCPRGSEEIWVYRSEKWEQRVSPNSTLHKGSSLHWL